MSKERKKYTRTDMEQMLDAAILIAEKVGYQVVTREMIAEKTGASPANVSRMFGTMDSMRRSIISAAIVRKNLRVIAQGLATKHSKALRAPEELRRAAAEFVVGG